MTKTTSSSMWRIPVSVLTPRTGSVFSRPSSQRKLRGWEWDWRSASRSLKPITVGCGRHPALPSGPRSLLHCRRPLESAYDPRGAPQLYSRGVEAPGTQYVAAQAIVTETIMTFGGTAERHIYIVDDDAAFCRSVERLLRSAGLTGVSFQSGAAFPKVAPDIVDGFVIIHVRMPGMVAWSCRSSSNPRASSCRSL
jgi:CheY-like chemotaxis protein